MSSSTLGRLVVVAAAVVSLQLVQAQGNTTLPTVDLGYEIHQASSFNETGGFYNFSNIRYAAPPVGNLRFAAPQAPAINRSQIQNGDVGRICPQGAPAWEATALTYLTDILLGIPFNTSAPPVNTNSSTTIDGRTSEDCLFLDVFVPQQIFESAGMGYGAPVLVWIYGGGYTSGNKYNNPAGLLAASGNVSDGDVIYVALNYRLGAFGWSSGPSFQAEGGVSNVGLLDQRFALEWVQNNIELFGGDPNRVTVFGESAGGGSIVHQITAYGGRKAPFQQAIPQSPGWQPINSNFHQEQTFQAFMNLTNTTSLAELRAMPSEVLIKANALQIAGSSYGNFSYGPVVDGIIVPAQPGQLLAQGRFDKSLRVMVGHNADEGPLFTNPYIQDDDDAKAELRTNFPSISEATLNYIFETLYPPIFDGSYGYTSQVERASLVIAEVIFTCNTFFLSRAFDNKTYSYLFAVPPAFHGWDVAYTYFTNGTLDPLAGVANRTIALALQEFITSFAKDGRPSADGVRKFEMYGSNAQVLDLNATGITEVVDSNAGKRCEWWQKSLYY